MRIIKKGFNFYFIAYFKDETERNDLVSFFEERINEDTGWVIKNGYSIVCTDIDETDNDEFFAVFAVDGDFSEKTPDEILSEFITESKEIIKNKGWLGRTEGCR